MKEKDKLDLAMLNEAANQSRLLQLFALGTQGAGGVGTGLTISGLVLTLIAIGGITAAFMTQVLTVVGAVSLFSMLGVSLAAYQLWQDQKKVNAAKELVDKNTEQLKKFIIELFKEYQLLTELKINVQDEIYKLEQLVSTYDEVEQKRIRDKITELGSEVARIERTQQELIIRLKVCLNVFSGASETEKLTKLFGKVSGQTGQEALVNYANLQLQFDPKDATRIKTAAKGLWSVLDQPIVVHQKYDEFRLELAQKIRPGLEEPHSLVKGMTYAVTAFGGFAGGVGATIGIATLIVGGVAALTAIGWPILVGAAAVGLVTMIGSVFYYRHVKKKQEELLKKLNTANAQVTGINQFLDESTRNIKKIDQELQAKHAKSVDEVSIRVNEHELAFREYKTNTQSYTRKAKSYIEELKAFNKFSLSSLTSLNDFKKEIETNILLLDALQKRVRKIAVTAGPEEVKIKLMHEIDLFLREAREDLVIVETVYQQINAKLHESAPRDKVAAQLPTVKQSVTDDTESEGEGSGDKENYPPHK